MSTDLEPVEEFRLRARSWLKENLPPAPERVSTIYVEEDFARARVLQKLLYDGGFAGICFPKEYGGLGLTRAHQQAFTEESYPYEMPLVLNMPTFAVCAPTILDAGSEEQKRKHIPAVLRGEEILCQFLSEPRGGSDLAGLTTRAERDGDMWVINGSKIWSSSAYASDVALCLVRTDPDAPKHRGLTMFLMPVHSKGVTIQRIRQINESDEFCQEFFDDVVLPSDAVLGEVNGGWAVASRQLFHERTGMGGGSPYFSGARPHNGGDLSDLVNLARRTDTFGDVRVREDIGEARAMELVEKQLIARVSQGMATGAMEGPAASIIRLFKAESIALVTNKSARIAGAAGVTGVPGTGEHGGDKGDLGRTAQDYIYRQANHIAGGSVEMARNVISERILGMPREQTADRDVPFREIKQGK